MGRWSHVGGSSDRQNGYVVCKWTVGLALVALMLTGCSAREQSGSFADGRNYALQHRSGSLASVCFAIYQLPHVPVPKGDNLRDWLSGCISVFPGQAPHLVPAP
jgi:hypothetical protein